MTEASLIKENKVKKVILGPGPVTAHEIDEHISIESYQKTINQYKEIIETFIVLKSKHAFADAGIEFLALPPSNIPMFKN